MDKQEKLLKILKEEQLNDGSFGRFHTMDSKLKRKIPTTEAAAWLMFENSINRQNEVCYNTCLYMENLLEDISQWPDSWEKNKYFAHGVPLFISSKLALFTSNNKKYNELCKVWISILISAFETNKYSKDAVNVKSKELIGVEIDGSYIGLHGLNNLALFSCNVDLIPATTQELYLNWLHNYTGKIAYTNIEPKTLVKTSKSERVISLLSKFDCFNREFSILTK